MKMKMKMKIEIETNEWTERKQWACATRHLQLHFLTLTQARVPVPLPLPLRHFASTLPRTPQKQLLCIKEGFGGGGGVAKRVHYANVLAIQFDGRAHKCNYVMHVLFSVHVCLCVCVKH